MHSSLSTTLPILAVLAASASAAHIPQSVLTARDAEFQDALAELYARDALADPGFGSWVKSEAHKVGGEAKKAGAWVANHQDQIVQGAENAARVAEAVKPFLPKKAARSLAQQEVLADLYARDAYPDPGFGSFIHKAEHGVEKAAKGAAHWAGQHKSQIKKGIEIGAQVAPILLARDAEPLDDDELLELYVRNAYASAYADPSFGSFIHDAEKKIGGAVKGAEQWAGAHKKQIGEVAGGLARVAPLLLRDAEPLVEDDELFELYVRDSEAWA